MSATLFQPEPSAKAPCTRTTFLICCFMIIFLSSLSFTDSCIGFELATTIVRNELSTIENTNHFCRFVLKMRREDRRKDHSRLEFNARTLADLRSATNCVQRRFRATPPRTAELRMGSIRMVEGIGVWVLRQKFCDLSVHASTLRE